MLKEKEAKVALGVYENLLKSSPSFNVVLSYKGEIQLVSKGFVDVLGYAEEELLLKPIFALVAPEDSKAILGELDRAARGGRTGKSETKFITKIGKVVTITWTISVDATSETMCLFGADISDYQQVISKVSQMGSEQAYYFYNIPDGIWYKDDKNNLLKINQAAADLIGKPIHEIEGHNVAEFFPEVADEFLKYDLEVIESGKPRYNHIQYYDTPSGIRIWSKTHSIPYINAETGSRNVLVMTMDITELKNTEERLRKSQKLYRILARQTPNFAVIIFDTTYKFLIAEGTALEAAGYYAEGMEGKTIYEVLDKESIEILLPYYTGTLEGESYSFQHKYDKRHYYVQMVPVRFDEKEGIEGGMIIINETTDVKKAEQKLIELNRTLEQRVKNRTDALEISNRKLMRINTYLDDFVFTAAHDLKTPIINIKQYLKLLNVVDASKKEMIKESMLKNVDGLNDVLNGLIEIIEFQQIDDTKVEAIDFNTLLDSALEKCNLTFEKTNAVVSRNFDKVPTINYVPVYMQSVMFNLLSNAIKYCNNCEENKIIVKTSKHEDYIVLSVKDHGVGIDLEKYGKMIFKPFKRLMPDKPGSGIGLNIIKNIVEKNGGYIKVESKFGEGSKFLVYLKPYSK